MFDYATPSLDSIERSLQLRRGLIINTPHVIASALLRRARALARMGLRTQKADSLDKTRVIPLITVIAVN